MRVLERCIGVRDVLRDLKTCMECFRRLHGSSFQGISGLFRGVWNELLGVLEGFQDVLRLFHESFRFQGSCGALWRWSHSQPSEYLLKLFEATSNPFERSRLGDSHLWDLLQRTWNTCKPLDMPPNLFDVPWKPQNAYKNLKKTSETCWDALKYEIPKISPSLGAEYLLYTVKTLINQWDALKSPLKPV